MKLRCPSLYVETLDSIAGENKAYNECIEQRGFKETS